MKYILYEQNNDKSLKGDASNILAIFETYEEAFEFAQKLFNKEDYVLIQEDETGDENEYKI